jgi:NitT/TauT family transport system substrate-binding protein
MRHPGQRRQTRFPDMLRRPVIRLCLILLAVTAGSTARAADHITFGLDWLAEAEYGGYYEAVATGAYARHGLDVEIRQGGPQVNQAQLLLAGKLDFTISGNSYLALNFAQQQLPFVAVAAMFQKDPSIILAHPGVGHDSFAALRGQPIMIGSDTRVGWWNFVRQKFGYSDDQIRPYTFNLAPFLADKMAIQQGYLGSEPYLVKQAAGFDPVVLSLADAGFAGYASLIATSTETATHRADLVQRFLAATEEGWHEYLDGNPAPGNALIKQANPEMTDALLAYGRSALKSHAIVEGGDTTRLGIGAMTDARWATFFHSMVAAKLYPANLDYHAAYTLKFIGNVADGK